MNNRNRILVGSMALMIWASGLIAPDFFVNTIYAEKPPSGGTTPAPTLVEIVGVGITLTPTVVYTVPTGKRFVLKDINVLCGPTYDLHRDTTLVTRSVLATPPPVHYESGIAFEAGTTVKISARPGNGGCNPDDQFYELRGFLEAQ